ncbi:hypothetical protein [Paraliomyxa miuraensis]|uniref:hypothetical protein n=1 Tax=Paraliomyxa miuraensis TaxID=376150 RepID=UPI002254FDA7|nr:hypothetical protein [Paraliomyxa miuraensis]MCX4239753.1 hypothetical protein [Paraliomyxa miuraensis]
MDHHLDEAALAVDLLEQPITLNKASDLRPGTYHAIVGASLLDHLPKLELMSHNEQ